MFHAIGASRLPRCHGHRRKAGRRYVREAIPVLQRRPVTSSGAEPAAGILSRGGRPATGGDFQNPTKAAEVVAGRIPNGRQCAGAVGV